MPYYPERVNELFLNPQNVGEVRGVNASAEAGSLGCGAILRLSLRIDAATQRISEAAFRAVGCGFLVAAASVLTETLKELPIGKAARLPETAITDWFDELPPERRQCAALCRDALQRALANYHALTQEEWTGDEALICTCFGVSEKSIERVIEARSLRTVGQVTRACNAGGGCGSCQLLIAEILEDYWRTKAVWISSEEDGRP
ncbi:MAG TPA: iron-sulfur cluster assembly scaffold protein [Pyrinomonadaceae bacterium]|jgi:NifU-like protein